LDYVWSMVLFSHGWCGNSMVFGGKGLVRKDLGNVARAGAGQLVCVDKESSVRVTGVHREHPMIDILLCALGLVAGGQEPAGTVRGEASLQSGGLSVVVVSVSISLRDVLEDNPPITLYVDGPGDLGVFHLGRTEVTLRSNPVGGIVGRWTLGGSGVVVIVEMFLLLLRDVLNQVIRGLIRDISVLLQEESILRDLVCDVICWIFWVWDTVWQVTPFGTLRRSLGITV